MIRHLIAMPHHYHPHPLISSILCLHSFHVAQGGVEGWDSLDVQKGVWDMADGLRVEIQESPSMPGKEWMSHQTFPKAAHSI